MENRLEVEYKKTLLAHYKSEVAFKEMLQKAIVSFTITYLKYLNTEKPKHWLEAWTSDEGYTYKKYENVTELNTNQIVDLFAYAITDSEQEMLPKQLEDCIDIIINDLWIGAFIESASYESGLAGYGHGSPISSRNELNRFMNLGQYYSGNPDLEELKEKIKTLEIEIYEYEKFGY